VNGFEIKATTDVYCIIGHPISHSLSPIIHNTAFKQYGIDAVYVAFDVKPEVLGTAVNGIKTLGIKGMTVTIPHKERIIPYLDSMDKIAQEIEAVNTVKNEGNKLIGYNTDVWGFLEPLKPYLTRLKEGSAILVGAGGAGRAIAYALRELKINKLFIANRTVDRGIQLVKYASKLGLEANFIGFDEHTLNEKAKSADLIINATPLGMHGVGGSIPINYEHINKNAIVYDIIPNPLETPLLKEARKAGAITISGVNMLVYQAVLAFKIWTGIYPDPKLLLDMVIKNLS